VLKPANGQVYQPGAKRFVNAFLFACLPEYRPDKMFSPQLGIQGLFGIHNATLHPLANSCTLWSSLVSAYGWSAASQPKKLLPTTAGWPEQSHFAHQVNPSGTTQYTHILPAIAPRPPPRLVALANVYLLHVCSTSVSRSVTK
jgi:hypothetical protein